MSVLRALKIVRNRPHGEETEVVGPFEVVSSSGEFTHAVGPTLTVSRVSPFGGEAGLHDVTVPLGDVVSIDIFDWEPHAA